MKNDNSFYPKLGSNIKTLRTFFCETQEELAFAIGASSGTTIANYENGFPPKREILQKIAKHYMITEDELLFSELKYSTKASDIPIYDQEHN